MSINQVIAFCLVAVLIGFLVVVALMAVQAIDLLKKTKVLVGVSKDAVEDVKGKADEISDGAITAVNGVIADSSIGVKAVAAVGAGLTALNVASKLVKSVLRTVGLIPAKSSRKERRKAAKEIRLSRKTIRDMNKQAKAERRAFAKAEKSSKKLQKKEFAIAKKEAKKAKAAQKIAAKAAAKELKSAVKLEAKEKKAAAKAAALVSASEARALKVARKAEKKEIAQHKKSVRQAAHKARSAEKKQARKLNRKAKRAAARAKRSAKRIAAKTAKKEAKKNQKTT